MLYIYLVPFSSKSHCWTEQNDLKVYTFTTKMTNIKQTISLDDSTEITIWPQIGKKKSGQLSFKSLWLVTHSIKKWMVNLLWEMKPSAATSTAWHTDGTYGPIESYARLQWCHAARFIMLVNSNSKAALNSRYKKYLPFLKKTTSPCQVELEMKKIMQQPLLNMLFISSAGQNKC